MIMERNNFTKGIKLVNESYQLQLSCSSFTMNQFYNASKLAVDVTLNLAYMVIASLSLFLHFEYGVLVLFHKSSGQLSQRKKKKKLKTKSSHSFFIK